MGFQTILQILSQHVGAGRMPYVIKAKIRLSKPKYIKL